MEKKGEGGISSTLVSAIAGALAMYLLDPDRGRRRRAMARDQLVHLGHQTRRDSSVIAADIFNRVKGFVAETRASLKPTEASDDVVKERIRSVLGRAVSHPHAVEVDARNGIVTLKGFILEDEIPAMITTVGAVRGVKEIIDNLERGRHPEEMPSLQGGRPRKAWKPDFLQTNQAPATRFLLGLGGAALLRNGIRRGGLLGTVSSFGGAVMLTRALTNMDMNRLLGTSEEEIIQVNKTIDIHAPIDQAFSFWRNLQNFPKFMEGLQELQVLDDLRSRWTAKGPLGIPVTWTAKITTIEPNRRISWKSEHGSSVCNSGHVFFQEVAPDITRMHVHLAYRPPLGGLGHAASTVFHADPKHRLDNDLLRLKSILEEGKTSAKGHEVSREQVEHPQVEVPVDRIVHTNVE